MGDALRRLGTSWGEVLEWRGEVFGGSWCVWGRGTGRSLAAWGPEENHQACDFGFMLSCNHFQKQHICSKMEIQKYDCLVGFSKSGNINIRWEWEGGPKTARVGAKRLGGFSFLGSGHLRDLIHKASADLRRPNMQRLLKTNQKQSICGPGAQLQLFLFVVLGCARHP
jgi:hypothetical protein